MTFLTSALSFIFAPFIAVGLMLGTALAPEPAMAPLGASEAIPTTIAFFETTLASAISDTATSFNLTSATDKDGTTLASSTYAFVIDEGSSNEEIVIADCTGTACVRVERGISARTGNTEVTALKKAHRRGASVKITDAPILMLVARALRGEDVTDFTPSGNGSLATKEYVDGIALGAGAVPATLTDDGIVELSTGLQAASSTATDQSGSPLTLHTGISTSTGGTAYTIPVTGSTGILDVAFLDGDFGKSFWASTTAGTSTWSVPSGITKVKVTVTGGGNDGGDCNNGASNYSGGGGGGAGATAISWYDVSATTSIQFVVGAAGNPSKFANTLIANGGTIGVDEGAGGTGATATGGDLNISGGGGDVGANEAALASNLRGGAGGSSYWGGGGKGILSLSAGDNGTAYGSGGGGAACTASETRQGGTGKSGIVLIEY